MNARRGALEGFCENTPKLSGNRSIAKDAPRRMPPITSHQLVVKYYETGYRLAPSDSTRRLLVILHAFCRRFTGSEGS